MTHSRASPHARRRASAGHLGVGGSGRRDVDRDRRASGVPVRCMNRSERLVGLLAARRPEPSMTVARSVADVLDEHVMFEVESIDRMYLNVCQPPPHSVVTFGTIAGLQRPDQQVCSRSE